MARFGGQMIAALAVWLGLAMLGYGPRAAASFLPLATGEPVPESGAAGIPIDPPTDSAPSLLSEFCRLRQGADCAQLPSGGAGSSPCPSSSAPASSSGMLATAAEVTGPTLSSRLRVREALLIPDPVAAAILEPPRIGR